MKKTKTNLFCFDNLFKCLVFYTLVFMIVFNYISCSSRIIERFNVRSEKNRNLIMSV